jgi:hypothetical protein
VKRVLAAAPGEGDEAAERGGESGDPAEDEPGAWPRELREPADEGPADRGRAEEDDRVERHHPPPHLGLGTELQGRVDPGREGDARRAERHQEDERDRE